MLNRILIAGGGKIGSLIACMLADSGDFDVVLTDIIPPSTSAQHPLRQLKILHTRKLDVNNHQALQKCLEQHQTEAIVSALPYHCNRSLAAFAHNARLYYFDLSEDTENANTIRQMADSFAPAFVPQCGLAPGFISIVANHLMTHFESIDTVKMRVGALPLHPNNALKYSLTWSTDGLINEYINPCYGLENGELVQFRPLEGYETITLDGDRYEAFNTSGGLGTLADTFVGKVNNMNYKTMRYPGHCKKMHLLLHELKLSHDRQTLKHILENALPHTLQDVVLIYVSVTGKRHGVLFEENDVRKIYPRDVAGAHWSAIQLSTAAGLCCVLDLTLQRQLRGFVSQESFQLRDVLHNRFGSYLDSDAQHAGRLNRQASQTQISHKTA